MYKEQEHCKKALIFNLIMYISRATFYLLLYTLLSFNNLLHLLCAKLWNNTSQELSCVFFQLLLMKLLLKLPFSQIRRLFTLLLKQTALKNFLCARHSSKHSTSLNSFISQSNPLSQRSLSPFANEETERDYIKSPKFHSYQVVKFAFRPMHFWLSHEGRTSSH